MTPLEIAYKYMACFYGQTSLDNMRALLADDMVFEGPFYRFDSGSDYFQSLQDDPPEGLSYEIINEFENVNCACLVYRFTRPGMETLMTQTFELKEGKIARMLLIFDTASFTASAA